jgi:hypothetical protein
MTDVQQRAVDMSKGVDKLIIKLLGKRIKRIKPSSTGPLQPTILLSRVALSIRRRQEGTGEWLLMSNEFQGWANQNKQILF